MGLKKASIGIAAVLFLVTFTGAALAQDGLGVRAGSFHISPMFGYHFFENDQHVDNAGSFGLGLGYNFTQYWGVELFGAYADTESERGLGDADLFATQLDAVYHLWPDQALVPFLVGGVGTNDVDYDWQQDDLDWAINVGAGIKYFFTDSVALRAELRGIHQFGDPEWNLAALVGLTFQLGGKTAPPPAPCTDSDGDGVCDDKDKCPDTPAGAKVDENGCPVILKEQVSIELKIEFDTAKWDIKPIYKAELQKVADFMSQYVLTKAVIEGHTDHRGSDAYNQKLSERRANSVREYLIKTFGLSPDRLSAVGYGESRPIAPNTTAEGMQRNRRVVAVITATIKSTE
ncbi:MAG: OmpA family protein [Thermodesulfobacteriota bacterium]